MEPPKILFKYVTIDRAIQILLNKTIRFTQPRLFNDPFEFAPTLDMKEIKEAYLNSPEIQNKIIVKEERKEVLKGLADFSIGVASTFINDYHAVGVLSLSEKWDIPLMWSHYCSNHSGVVIGFDVQKGILLDKPNTTNGDSYCDISPINYQKDRLKFPNKNYQPLDYMFCKDICWDYEKEWRILRSLKTLKKIEDEIYVSEFQPESIRCVIRGPRFPKNQIWELSNILGRSEYRHVGFFASNLEADTFGMDITTNIASVLNDGDLYLEKYHYKHIDHVYRLISKGHLYQAMEIIEDSIEFKREKDYWDLYGEQNQDK